MTNMSASIAADLAAILSPIGEASRPRAPKHLRYTEDEHAAICEAEFQACKDLRLLAIELANDERIWR